MTGHRGETLFVSGFPGSRARRLLEHLLAREPEASLIALVRESEMPAAEAFRAEQSADARARLRFLPGDPGALDLGLSGAAYVELSRSVDRIYHFASQLEHSAGEGGAAANLAGGRELVELARSCARLRGVVLLSSAFVSGTRRGVVLESELSAGQRFRGAVDESLAIVEQMLERHAELPAIVLRPTQIVGDVRAGQVDTLPWPYPLIAWVVNGPDEIALALPRAHAALHVAPIDFVVSAAHYLACEPRNYGRRFHLCDEHPPTIEELVVLLAEKCDKRIAPGLNAFTRGLSSGNFRLMSDSVRSLFDVQGGDTRYDCAEARAALAGSDIACPPLESYLPALIAVVKSSPPIETEERGDGA